MSHVYSQQSDSSELRTRPLSCQRNVKEDFLLWLLKALFFMSVRENTNHPVYRAYHSETVVNSCITFFSFLLWKAAGVFNCINS